MSSICNGCAIRLQRLAHKVASNMITTRAFSASTLRWRALQSFPETSSEQLNGLLTTLREKHLIPAYLDNHQRKLIFKLRNKQYLLDNPQTVQLGGEEIQLQWIDRLREIPAREPLVKEIIKMILESKDHKAWECLPALMRSMREGVKKPLTDAQMEKIVRKAFQQKRYIYVLRCMQQVDKTGMSMKDEGVLRAVMMGFHELAEKSNWEKAHVEKALRDMSVVAVLLESEGHGGGPGIRKQDARRKPEVLAVMLELTAVYAYKHTDGKDTNGMVKTYADRLLSCMRGEHISPSITLADKGPQWSFLQAVPILHGLLVANKVLGKDMPKQDLAKQIIAAYEEQLSVLAAELEQRSPERAYDEQAMQAWRRCIRD